MRLGTTEIDDTFAEAFRMRFARLVVTAHDEHWVRAAAREATGYGSSIIACDAEAGVERWLEREETPDGRPGASLLFFGFSEERLAPAVTTRLGQTLMTCPSAAVYDGLPEVESRHPLGDHVRYFGDGFQKSKVVGERRFWRIPVMDGEFLVEDSIGIEKGIAGGNIIVQGRRLEDTLDAIRAAVEAIERIPGVITPFPGGAVRSGSKVGSRYAKLRASTNDEFCPTLRGRVQSRLHPDAQAACEIVIDGVDEASVGLAMAAAMEAAAGPEILAISAGNYGGNLGKFHFGLFDVLGSGSR